jgi:hypothetical protein
MNANGKIHVNRKSVLKRNRVLKVTGQKIKGSKHIKELHRKHGNKFVRKHNKTNKRQAQYFTTCSGKALLNRRVFI